jgi:hypothetical protein
LLQVSIRAGFTLSGQVMAIRNKVLLPWFAILAVMAADLGSLRCFL